MHCAICVDTCGKCKVALERGLAALKTPDAAGLAVQGAPGPGGSVGFDGIGGPQRPPLALDGTSCMDLESIPHHMAQFGIRTCNDVAITSCSTLHPITGVYFIAELCPATCSEISGCSVADIEKMIANPPVSILSKLSGGKPLGGKPPPSAGGPPSLNNTPSGGRSQESMHGTSHTHSHTHDDGDDAHADQRGTQTQTQAQSLPQQGTDAAGSNTNIGTEPVAGQQGQQADSIEQEGQGDQGGPAGSTGHGQGQGEQGGQAGNTEQEDQGGQGGHVQAGSTGQAGQPTDSIEQGQQQQAGDSVDVSEESVGAGEDSGESESVDAGGQPNTEQQQQQTGDSVDVGEESVGEREDSGEVEDNGESESDAGEQPNTEQQLEGGTQSQGGSSEDQLEDGTEQRGGGTEQQEDTEEQDGGTEQGPTGVGDPGGRQRDPREEPVGEGEDTGESEDVYADEEEEEDYITEDDDSGTLFGIPSVELNPEKIVPASDEIPFYPLLDPHYGVCYQFKPNLGTAREVKTVGLG